MLQLALELQFYVTVIFLKDKIQNNLNLMDKGSDTTNEDTGRKAKCYKYQRDKYL